MELPLKQRLVGAGVIVLVMVLVLPELLSGRREVVAVEPTHDEGGVPLRAHEFVMGDAPTAEEQAVEADTLQPDPAVNTPDATLSADETVPEAALAVVPGGAAGTPTAAVPSAPAPTPPAVVPAGSPAVPTAPAPTPAKMPAAEKTSPPAKTPPAAPKAPSLTASTAAMPQHLGAWVVQIGSFGTAQKAEQLVADLRGRGFRAFTLPYTANGRTLHRVRVGPEQNRKVADDIARRLAGLGYTPHVAPQE